MTVRNSKFNNNNVMVKVFSDRTTIRKEYSIIIIGDRHSKGYSAEGKNHLTTNFKEIGLIKPGVGVEILVKSAMSDSKFN
jgi:hypothetical protein